MPEDSVDGMGGRPEWAPPPSRPNRTVTPAIAGALVVLAASFALSVAFVLANGGLDLPAAQRAAGSGDVAGGVPSATAAGAGEASVAPTVVSPAPSSTEVPGTAKPATTATPRPSSNRYDLLRACPDAPDCWIYTVRGGDNLVSIARYFGVPFEVVTKLNPWTTTKRLVAGQELRLPPPTR